VTHFRLPMPSVELVELSRGELDSFESIMLFPGEECLAFFTGGKFGYRLQNKEWNFMWATSIDFSARKSCILTFKPRLLPAILQILATSGLSISILGL